MGGVFQRLGQGGVIYFVHHHKVAKASLEFDFGGWVGYRHEAWRTWQEGKVKNISHHLFTFALSVFLSQLCYCWVFYLSVFLQRCWSIGVFGVGGEAYNICSGISAYGEGRNSTSSGLVGLVMLTRTHEFLSGLSRLK